MDQSLQTTAMPTYKSERRSKSNCPQTLKSSPVILLQTFSSYVLFLLRAWLFIAGRLWQANRNKRQRTRVYWSDYRGKIGLSLQYVTFSTADGALEAAPACDGRCSSEVSRNHLYGAGSNAVHFIVKSSRAATKLASYCLDHKQQLMRKVEDAISRVFVAFDEYMRRLFELR
ncbi:hypothetical protein M9H77_26533 [Catharanthus roseus]|uniref:Uncharacterized protein n=1 Tax=Catharanthus roseus TaxID=4058 RepID=A0ACC0ABT8_CATRO|nr:hypothetical protein M9H77_26533 [Catharanthus roseus]